MRTFKLAAVLLLCCSLTGFAGDKETAVTHVSVLASKNEIFYFKVSKELLGALVEIFDETGAIIHSEKVTKRNTVIDFFHRKEGKYTIKITKGEIVEMFECLFNYR